MIKFFIKCVVFSCIFVGFKTAYASLNKAQIYEYAEVYGYKTAHLIELNRFIEQSLEKIDNLPENYRVKVPLFYGVSSKQMNYILNAVGIDLEATWIFLLKKHISDLDECFNNKQIPSIWIDELEVLGTQIAQACKNIEYETLPNDLKVFITEAEKNKNKLMVRSTGKEDTHDVVNAGGNESVANVLPKISDVACAIGKVLSSYLSRNSLQQRINAGDKTIFQVPMLSILLQVMIGETDDMMPTSGVMFTQESHGFTPHIVQIQSTYGHNEAVVNTKHRSKILVDNFYVNSVQSIHAVVRPKKNRLVPSELSHQLIYKENASNIQNEPSLCQEAIVSLAFSAGLLEQYFEGPLDIEFVVDQMKKIIYIVQVRPISKLPQIASASNYLMSLKNRKYIRLEPIVTTDMSVRFISEKNQIFMCENLQKGLEIYNSLPIGDKKKLVCIITQEPTGSMSHAAIEFRSDNKLCFFMKDYKVFKKWIEEQNHIQLLIDSQRCLIVDASDILDYSSLTQNGLLNHPLPQKKSLITWQLPVVENIFALKLFEREEPFIDIKNFPEKDIKDMLEILKEADYYEAQSVLHHIMNYLYQITYASEDCLSKSEKTTGEILFNYALITAQEILCTLSYPPRDINRLYAITILETLLFQQEDNLVVNAYSFHSILKNRLRQKQFREEVLDVLIEKNKLSSEFIQDKRFIELAHRGFQVGISDVISEQWISFLDIIYQQKRLGDYDKLTSLMNELDMYNLMSAWLVLVFNPNKSIDELHLETMKIISEFSELLLYKQLLEMFDYGEFKNPCIFDKTWSYFQKQFLRADFIKNVTERLKENAPLSNIMILSLLRCLIETFDISIKSLKGSTQFQNDSTKVECFKIMIREYFQLLKKMLEVLPHNVLPYYREWPQRRYLGYLERHLESCGTHPYQLQGSKDFNVGAAAIGNATKIDRKLPETLEDLFTTIHQSLLNITAALMKDYVAFEKIEEIQSIERVFSALENKKYHTVEKGKLRFHLTGVDLHDGGVSYTYNIPMAYHSAKFVVDSYKDEKSINIQVTFFGWWYSHIHRIRLQLLHETCQILADKQLISSVQKHNDFEFTIKINKKDLVEKSKEIELYLEFLFHIMNTHRFKDELFFPFLPNNNDQKEIVSLLINVLMQSKDTQIAQFLQEGFRFHCAKIQNNFPDIV